MTIGRMDVAGAVVFAGFVLLALATRRGAREERWHRLRVSVFILYCLGLSLAVGVTRRNLFPFHDWALIAGVLPDTIQFTTLVAVDSTGADQDIDYRAWEPISVDDVTLWAFDSTRFFALDSAAQALTTRYLVQQLEAARRAARSGQRLGTYSRFLGPLAAPSFLLHRPAWTEPARTPPAPLIGLRWYVDGWRSGPQRARNQLGRTLRHEVLVRP